MFLRRQPDDTPTTTLLLHWEHWDASPSTPVSPFCPFYNIGVSFLNLNIRQRAALIIKGLLGNLEVSGNLNRYGCWTEAFLLLREGFRALKLREL